jgi:hypothetical protein
VCAAGSAIAGGQVHSAETGELLRARGGEHCEVLSERCNLRVQGQPVRALEGIALAIPVENQAMRLACPVSLIDRSNSPTITTRAVPG